MIYLHPRPIDDDPGVGSATHAASMLAGFRAVADHVEVVAGDSSSRRRAFRRIVREISLGRRVDLVYASLATTAIALSDPDHVPRHPFQDAAFLRRVRRSGTRVTAFYPDVYWRFPEYRAAVRPPKRHAAIVAYRLELAQLAGAVDELLLPSLEMARHVPGWEHDPRVRALAPGCVPIELADPPGPELHLLYVGAVRPPLYDIAPLVEAVLATDGIALTVCCPAEHRPAVDDWSRCDRVRIVHERGDALLDLYRRADAACLAFAPNRYRSFAMPVKLFEAIGMGRPVLATSGTAAGHFVAEQRIGWAVPPSALGATLRRVVDARHEVVAARDRVRAMRNEHTWAQRCRQIVDRVPT